MPIKYSVVLGTLRSGDQGCDVWKHPNQVLEAILEAGYDGVDIDAEPDRISNSSYEEMKKLTSSLGLQVPALLGAWAPWHAGEERDLASTEEEVRKRGINYAQRSINLASSFDKPPLFQLCACPLANEYPLSSTPYEILRRNFLDSTKIITEYAFSKNVNIAIEPITKFEGYAGFLNKVPEALELIEEVNATNLGIQTDFFHMNIEDADFFRTLKSTSGKLMHVHMADTNRGSLGTGHLNFSRAVSTLSEINYTGYLSLDSVPAKPNWKTMIDQGINYMKGIERKQSINQN